MRILLTVLFFSVGLSVMLGAHYYVWARLVRDTALPAPWRQTARATLGVLYLSMPLSLVLYRLVPSLRGVVRGLLWPIYIWMGAVLILVTVLAFGDLLRGAARVLGRVIDTPPTDPERRLLLGRMVGSLTAAVSSVLTTTAMRTALGPVQVQEVSVTLPRLPEALDGLTIVQLSDIHFGPTIGRAFAETIVAQCNALAPDVIAITGDLVDGTVAELQAAVAPLGELRARYGAYFVTGNHEYYVTREAAVGADAWIAELKRLGIHTLRNARVSIGTSEASFDLAGIDDWSAHGGDHGPDLARAVSGRDRSRELVLLAHQPRAIREAMRHGVGLQLSGHTHGGQIWPWNYLVWLQQPFVAGLERFADTQLYVNSGTGYWGPPMRLGTTPEITRIRLRAKPRTRQ